jgi:pilus assembly protein Flp/PilA
MYDVVNYVRIRLTAMARTERGATAVEYGLLVALIAVAIIVAVGLLGGSLKGIFTKTASSISNS